MSMLPSDAKERKGMPITRGVIDYFPDALAEIARVSLAGNKQHYGPDAPLHWDKSLANDHADCITRHLIDRGTRDKDGQRHSAKLAWRALALLQIELEEEAAKLTEAAKNEAALDDAGISWRGTAVLRPGDIPPCNCVKCLTVCTLPPIGWHCTRGEGHPGPCAAVKSDYEDLSERAI